MDIEAIRRGAEAPIAAQAADVDAVAADLAAAFSTDPMFDWFMRPDDKRAPARLGFFRTMLRRMALPTGVVERPSDGGAAAIWMRSEDLAPTSPLAELPILPTILRATGLKRLSRLSKLRSAMDAHHPAEPHDYLWFLGVHPAAQGAGVGSRLLAQRTARLDATGRAAFLETATPRNVALYNRHGFEIRDEYHAMPGAPLMWTMWRAPRS